MIYLKTHNILSLPSHLYKEFQIAKIRRTECGLAKASYNYQDLQGKSPVSGNYTF